MAIGGNMWIMGILSFLFWLRGAQMPQSASTITFSDVLCSEGPASDQRDKMTLYNPLLGDWEVDVIDYAPDGTRQKSKGEWHFSWVLEGRAIQDVFVVPSRANRVLARPVKSTRYGTSLRVYDPAASIWNVTWINPVNGSHNMLIGRSNGDEILQEGKDPNGSLIRWIFSGITPNSFHWRGEVSTDDGKTWSLVSEFFGRRIAAVNPGK
jgi:hypothetical protein